VKPSVTKRATPLAIKIAHQGDFSHKIGVLGALPLTRLQREARGASFAYLATQKFMLWGKHQDGSTCTSAKQDSTVNLTALRE
jgi:hypothetical protein